MRTLPISKKDKEYLRTCMPQVLDSLYGITNLNRKFCCPNPEHEDENPSASYWADDMRVHCFACGGSYDVFDIVGLHSNIGGFIEKAREVARIVGYSLDCESVGRSTEKTVHLNRDRVLNFHKRLMSAEGTAGRQWLFSRGLTEEDLERYTLGFTMRPRDVSPKFRFREVSDVQGYIVFPYMNASGSEAVYASLRPVPGNTLPKSKEWLPKEVKRHLWQEHLLSSSLPKISVHEGILDAISYERLFNVPSVGIGGTGGVTDLLITLLQTPPENRPQHIEVCMDNDDAGHNVSSKITEVLNSQLQITNSVPEVMRVEGIKDANDLLLAALARGESTCGGDGNSQSSDVALS